MLFSNNRNTAKFLALVTFGFIEFRSFEENDLVALKYLLSGILILYRCQLALKYSYNLVLCISWHGSFISVMYVVVE